MQASVKTPVAPAAAAVPPVVAAPAAPAPDNNGAEGIVQKVVEGVFAGLPTEGTGADFRITDGNAIRTAVQRAYATTDEFIGSATILRLRALGALFAHTDAEKAAEALTAKAAGLPAVKDRSPEQKSLASRYSESLVLLRVRTQAPASDWQDFEAGKYGAWNSTIAAARKYLDNLRDANRPNVERERIEKVLKDSFSGEELKAQVDKAMDGWIAKRDAMKDIAETPADVAKRQFARYMKDDERGRDWIAAYVRAMGELLAAHDQEAAAKDAEAAKQPAAEAKAA